LTDIVLACCRDEADIIETFVLYYLEMGFDEVYIFDNGSVDGTGKILEELATSGLPVFAERDPRLGYERFLTDYYLSAGRRAGARWVFFVDCDEFILFPGPAKNYLDALPSWVNCLRLRQKEMYPRLNEPSGQGEFLLSTRSQVGFNDTTKDVSRFDPKAKVHAGKHLISFSDRRAMCPDDIFIRHYKYRTLDQARRKELNRVQSHSSYSDEEIMRLSAFGLDRTRRWFETCRDELATEAWRSRFSLEMPATEDLELAAWAAGFLERRGRRSVSRADSGSDRT